MIREKIISLGLDCCPEIVNPNGFDRINDYTQVFTELRQRKGVTRKDATKRVLDPNVFGSLMVKMGDADAFISGLTYKYPEVIRQLWQHTPSFGHESTASPVCRFSN